MVFLARESPSGTHRTGHLATSSRGTVALLVVLGCANAHAVDAAAQRTDWEGTFGVGPVIASKYVGSSRIIALPIPLVSASYRDTLFLDFDRAGVNLWATEHRDLAFSLVASPRWGHAAHSGPRLTGMATRRDSVEGGPNVGFTTAIADINVGYFHDLVGASRGATLRLALDKEVVARGGLNVELTAEVERISDRVADYYFGVRTAEALPTRPAYVAPAGIDLTLALDAAYSLSPSNSLVIGVAVTRLGNGEAASPIVETRRAGLLWIGYAWKL